MQQLLTVLIQKQRLIKWLFFGGYVMVIAVWLSGGVAYSQLGDPDYMLYEIGSKFGTIAVILYSLTLIPGILKRMQLLPQLAVVGMLYRRQVGILMFLSAFVHYSFTTLFPFVILQAPLVLDTAKQFGFFSLVITMILFLTSNDTAQAKLGKFWNWLHRLTYVLLVLIFAHVAYMEFKWAVVLGVIAVFEIISWVAVWRRSAVR